MDVIINTPQPIDQVAVEIHKPTPPPIVYDGWRGLHMAEGGRIIPYSMPAVIPPVEQVALEMTYAIQRMSYALMVAMNNAVTPKIWRAVHRWGLCLNNGHQDGYDGNIPHADYINNQDLGASLPRYDKQQRTFQGTFIRGDKVGDVIICRPGIHGIDARQPMPDVDTIIKNNWYVIACNVGPSHNVGHVTDFAQGQGDHIVYPFIFDRAISFPAYYFEKWTREYLPDPLRLYHIG